MNFFKRHFIPAIPMGTASRRRLFRGAASTPRGRSIVQIISVQVIAVQVIAVQVIAVQVIAVQIISLQIIS